LIEGLASYGFGKLKVSDDELKKVFEQADIDLSKVKFTTNPEKFKALKAQILNDEQFVQTIAKVANISIDAVEKVVNEALNEIRSMLLEKLYRIMQHKRFQLGIILESVKVQVSRKYPILLLLIGLYIFLCCERDRENVVKFNIVKSSYVWDTIAVVQNKKIISTDSGKKLEIIYNYDFRGVKYTNKTLLDTFFYDDFTVNEEYILSVNELDYSKSKILPYKNEK
jgi:hypothetical protein